MSTNQPNKSEHEYLMPIVEKAYERELALKNEISSRSNTFLTIFALVAAILAFYVTSITIVTVTVMHYILFGALVLAIIAGIIALIFFGRFLIGHAYGYIPDASRLGKQYAKYLQHAEDVKTYNAELQQHNLLPSVQQVPYDPDVNVGDEMDAYLIRQYCKTASDNRSKNIERARIYHRAIIWLAITTGIALSTAVPFFYIKIDTPTAPNTANSSVDTTLRRQRMSEQDGNLNEQHQQSVQPPKKPDKPGDESPDYLKEGEKPKIGDIPTKEEKGKR